MLYQPSDLPRPMRLQGVFVSDAEIARVVDHWKGQIEDPMYDMAIIDTGDESTGSVDDLADEDADRLLPDAIEVIREYDRASASLLQRRLKVGYARAARMIDQLEARGYIGAFDGSNARPVLRRDEAGGIGRSGRPRGRRMTTREQLKRAVRVDRSEAERNAGAEPGPSLPERLYAARERKGVDLYRAERDTKIRARYLGALERGDYKELPGAVYTKGFLRNYALYLGLDPEEVLLQWRRERGDGKEAAPAIVVPKPIAAPRQGLTFSPSIVVAALLTIVVIAFGAYLGVQVLRFAKPPTIAVTQPATAVIDVDESTTALHPGRDDPAGRHRVDRDAGPRPLPGHRPLRRQVVGRRRPASRAEPVRRERRGPRDRQAFRGHGPRVHHRAVPADRGADPDRRPAVRRRVVRERCDPGRRQGHERRVGRGQRGLGRLVRDRRPPRASRRPPRRRRRPR